MTTQTRSESYRSGASLYMSMELAEKRWKLAFGVELAANPRLRTIAARDLVSLQREVKLSRKRYGLSEDCAVVSCYEAGRDGFWIHRYLESEGVRNQVVDPSSLRVSRRRRRAKTDRLDAEELLRHLIRSASGEPRVWSVVRVPTVEQEAGRWLHRELETLKKERTAHFARMRSLLALYGPRIKGQKDFLARALGSEQWDGRPMPDEIQLRLAREWERQVLVEEQIKALQRQRREMVREREDLAKVRRLATLKGIGDNCSWNLVMECFGWREFDNRRQLGGFAGLVPTPYNSGESVREQGISKAGNRRVRWLMVQIAWGWLRHQPDSALTRWFMERFATGSKRSRRVGIIALARKLLIALWRWVEFDELPEGALLKAGAQLQA